VDHLGSDAAVWQGLPLTEIKPALKQAVANLTNAVNRPLDVTFAIDQMTKMDREGDSPLKGRLDLDRIGVAGHSFGGYTTLAIAGEVFILPDGSQRSLPDPRVKAAIAMSAPVPDDKSQLDLAFSKIKTPVFHMTGTLDDSPVGETTAAERRIPFDHIHNPDQYLVIFNGGDHMIFSGRLIGRSAREKDVTFQKLICAGSAAFWDAYLKDDKKALAWLNDGGFKGVLRENGSFERK
jgi:predicted dienelactone hydrolase